MIKYLVLLGPNCINTEKTEEKMVAATEILFNGTPVATTLYLL
jgi:hypothetical protein